MIDPELVFSRKENRNRKHQFFIFRLDTDSEPQIFSGRKQNPIRKPLLGGTESETEIGGQKTGTQESESGIEVEKNGLPESESGIGVGKTLTPLTESGVGVEKLKILS